MFRKAVEGSHIYYIQFRLLLLSSIMRAQFSEVRSSTDTFLLDFTSPSMEVL